MAEMEDDRHDKGHAIKVMRRQAITNSPASVSCSGQARVPGSCGELAQGMLHGRRLLISCPVDHSVAVHVTLGPGRSSRTQGLEQRPKAKLALRLALEQLDQPRLDAQLRIEYRAPIPSAPRTPLPWGRGMASSTADVAAVIAAVFRAFGRTPSGHDVARLAARVEPSDSVMLPGLALFDYHAGDIVQAIGTPPPLRVLALDWGGQLDTLAFNQRPHAKALAQQSAAFKEAVDRIIAGVTHHAPAEIGAGATLSAKTHQAILPKPQLAAVESLARRVGALGITVAHSGTVMGLLMPDDADRMQVARKRAFDDLPGLLRATPYQLCGGGTDY